MDHRCTQVRTSPNVFVHSPGPIHVREARIWTLSLGDTEFSRSSVGIWVQFGYFDNNEAVRGNKIKVKDKIVES